MSKIATILTVLIALLLIAFIATYMNVTHETQYKDYMNVTHETQYKELETMCLANGFDGMIEREDTGRMVYYCIRGDEEVWASIVQESEQ
jgi:hypothetical protein